MASSDDGVSEVNVALRGLMDVAKVALGPGGPELPQDEAAELMIRLLAIVDRTMPLDLQVIDIRVAHARLLVQKMKQ